MESEFIGNEVFENLIQGLVDSGYGLTDNFLPPDIAEGLRTKLLDHLASGSMHPARVGRKFDYQQNADVRGDVIQWITKDSSNPSEMYFLKHIEEFIAYLNRTCFTTINNYEFHYACYEEGTFYRRHLDQFKTDRGRQFSMVLYLNDNWLPENKGEVSLYIPSGEIRFQPLINRMLFFKSDVTEHEVHASVGRPRLSIAGWLKSDFLA